MINNLLQIYGDMIAKCIIVAIETIGLVTYLDTVIDPDKKISKRHKCILELVVCLGCSIVNSDYLGEAISLMLNIFLLGLSITQMAYDYIVRGIPKFLDKLLHLNNSESK